MVTLFLKAMFKDIDCSKQVDPLRCRWSKKASQACQSKQGKNYLNCVFEKEAELEKQNRECAGVTNTYSTDCETRRAYQACKDKYGESYRACMRALGQ